MRLGKKLVGMKVFSLSAGQYIASVQDLLFDARVGKVFGFIVAVDEPEAKQFSDDELVILLEEVHRIGADAVTVADLSVVRPISQVPEAIRLGHETPTVVGQPVMTTAGTLLGTIDDILMDPQSGDILGYQLSDGLIKDLLNGRVAIPASKSYHLGSEAMIVPEDTAERLRVVDPLQEESRFLGRKWREQLWQGLSRGWDEEMVGGGQLKTESDSGQEDKGQPETLR